MTLKEYQVQMYKIPMFMAFNNVVFMGRGLSYIIQLLYEHRWRTGLLLLLDRCDSTLLWLVETQVLDH